MQHLRRQPCLLQVVFLSLHIVTLEVECLQSEQCNIIHYFVGSYFNATATLKEMTENKQKYIGKEEQFSRGTVKSQSMADDVQSGQT
jgi:hypothetical protein